MQKILNDSMKSERRKLNKKIASCGFCSISSHRTTCCSLKKGIDSKTAGDSLMENL